MTRRDALHLAALAVAAVVVAVLWVAAFRVTWATDPIPTTARPTTPAVTEVEPAHVAVIGDSYTGGSDEGGYGPANWTRVAAAALDAEGLPVTLTVAAEGGAGYVAEGVKGHVFADLVPDAVTPATDLVVLFGSRNDTADITDAAQATIAAAQATAPDAALIVIGPPWVDDDPPANVVASRDALAAVAAEVGAVFVDPLENGWFVGTDLIGGDGVHPTDDGHAYMAELILPHLRAALGG